VPESDEEGDGRDAIGELKELSSVPAGLRIRAAAPAVSDSMGSNGTLPPVVLERIYPIISPKLRFGDFCR
jgi:hypothetical protein